MFITLTALGVVAPAFALEVKLLCSIKLIARHSGGAVQKENFTEVIDVAEIYGQLRITPQSPKLFGVWTIKSPKTLSVNNSSDSNKWNMEETKQVETGLINKTILTIDRNTGILFYFNDWDGGTLVTSATGSCEKVDATKRKF